MFADTHKSSFYEEVRQRDFRLFAHIITLQRIGNAASLAGIRLGRGILTVPVLVWLALLGALHVGLSFLSILGLALKLFRDDPSWNGSPLQRLHDRPRLSQADHPGCKRCKRKRRGRRQQKPRKNDHRGKAGYKSKPQDRSACKHDPHGPDDRRIVTEEAFVQARQKLPWKFWFWLLFIVAEEFTQQYRQYVLWKGYRLLAMDGTLINLEHWQGLADHFGTASNGKASRRPQLRLLMIEFPLSRMPWLCQWGPKTVSEATMAAKLMPLLRRNDLLLMDRGFFSYGLFWQIQNQGGFFATRLKAGVKFKKVRRVGQDDQLVTWTPSDHSRWKNLPASIELRVVKYHVKGYRPSAVVTNVLDAKKITREEWIRVAVQDEAGRVLEPGLYHRRWEIETSFAELKVTQEMEGRLRSRTAAGINYEIGGHLILYQAMRWLMAEAAAEAGGKDPLRLSYKRALQEVREQNAIVVRVEDEYVQRQIRPRLLERLASYTVPLRPGRSYQRKGAQSASKYGKSCPNPSKTKAKHNDKTRPQKTAPPTPNSVRNNGILRYRRYTPHEQLTSMVA